MNPQQSATLQAACAYLRAPKGCARWQILGTAKPGAMSPHGPKVMAAMRGINTSNAVWSFKSCRFGPSPVTGSMASNTCNACIRTALACPVTNVLDPFYITLRLISPKTACAALMVLFLILAAIVLPDAILVLARPKTLHLHGVTWSLAQGQGKGPPMPHTRLCWQSGQSLNRSVYLPKPAERVWHMPVTLSVNQQKRDFVSATEAGSWQGMCAAMHWSLASATDHMDPRPPLHIRRTRALTPSASRVWLAPLGCCHLW